MGGNLMDSQIKVGLINFTFHQHLFWSRKRRYLEFVSFKQLCCNLTSVTALLGRWCLSLIYLTFEWLSKSFEAILRKWEFCLMTSSLQILILKLKNNLVKSCSHSEFRSKSFSYTGRHLFKNYFLDLKESQNRKIHWKLNILYTS